jgi:hypothetical protein
MGKGRPQITPVAQPKARPGFQVGAEGGGKIPLLYLRQPGYVVGKAQLDKMLARASHQAEATGNPFSLKETFAAIWASGIVPPSIIDSEFLDRLR